jgi:hypothetical protein
MHPWRQLSLEQTGKSLPRGITVVTGSSSKFTTHTRPSKSPYIIFLVIAELKTEDTADYVCYQRVALTYPTGQGYKGQPAHSNTCQHARALSPRPWPQSRTAKSASMRTNCGRCLSFLDLVQYEVRPNDTHKTGHAGARRPHYSRISGYTTV